MSKPDLNSLPRKDPPIGSDKAAPDKSAGSFYLYIDYDTAFASSNKIYANWQRTATEACRDKTISYVERDDLLDYDYVEDCRGSTDGIWRFTIQS